MTLQMLVGCPYCKGTHLVDLDASGHGEGHCEETGRTFALQVNPQDWRKMIEQQNEKKVH